MELNLLRPILVGITLLLIVFLVILILSPFLGTQYPTRRVVLPSREAYFRPIPVLPSGDPPGPGNKNGSLTQPISPGTGAVNHREERHQSVTNGKATTASSQGQLYHFMRGDLTTSDLCLTFDGSVEAEGVLPILQILAEKHLRCTFFLSGEFQEAHPDLVRAIASAGHEVGNHLYRHIHLTTWEINGHQLLSGKISKTYFQKLLKENEELFFRLTGKTMVPFWRAPYGESNSELEQWAAELHYLHVSWTRDRDRGQSMDSLDWVAEPDSPRYLSARQIEERILNFDGGVPGGANGAIILMHLGSKRKTERPWTVLGSIIDKMKQKGYRFVTVSQLVGTMISNDNKSGK